MSTRCHIDGATLDVDTDWLGRTVIKCVACDRRRSKRCQDCGAPVEGRAWRCPTHLAAAKHRDERTYHNRHRKERQAKDRKYHREHREARNAVKAEWRAKNKVRIKRSRFGQKNNGYRTREKYLAYQGKYNAARREEKRADARARYYAKHPTRPQPTCTECAAPIPYAGAGRPAKWCTAHRPFQAFADRRKAA